MICVAVATWLQFGGAFCPDMRPPTAFIHLRDLRPGPPCTPAVHGRRLPTTTASAEWQRRAGRPGAWHRQIAGSAVLRCTPGSEGSAGAGRGAAGTVDARRIDDLLAEVWAGNDGHCSSEAEDAQIDQVAGEL